MAINQTISNFLVKAGNVDFARNNLYRVMALKTRVLELDESDLLYCKGGILPGRTNPIAAVKFHGMDVHYNKSSIVFPGSDSYKLTFYVDAAGEIRKKFEQASNLIFNPASNTGNWRVPAIDDILSIAQLGFNLEPIHYFHLYGVTVAGIDQIETNQAEGDGSAIEVGVTFAFQYYKTDGSDAIYTE